MNERETLQADDDEIQEDEIQDENQEDEIQEDQNAPSVEDRAMKMGWVPQEQFRGDPDKWRSAEEFVDRGEKMIPILRANIKRLEKSQAEKDKAFEKYLADVRAKLHEQKVQDHERQKRQAVEEGDTDTYNRLSSVTVENDLPEYQPPKVDADFENWVDENPWYRDDFDKFQEAENYGRFLKNTNPDLEGRAFLDEVSKHIRQKFSNPNRNRPSSVDSGTPKAKSGKLFEKLDAEAKATFSSFVRDGIFKNTAEHREAYAKDVLS